MTDSHLLEREEVDMEIREFTVKVQASKLYSDKILEIRLMEHILGTLQAGEVKTYPPFSANLVDVTIKVK